MIGALASFLLSDDVNGQCICNYKESTPTNLQRQIITNRRAYTYSGTGIGW